MCQNNSCEAEHELILKNTGYARMLAREFHSKRTSLGIEHQEYVGAALLALCDAAKRFDSSKGAHFKTFCYFRIRGAMLDLVRRDGFIPRGCYDRAVLNPPVEPQCVQEGSAPGYGAEAGNTLPFVFAKSASELVSLNALLESLNLKVYSVPADPSVVELGYSSESDPETEQALLQARGYLQELIHSLPRAQRHAIELRFYREQTFDEMVESMNETSKSRVTRTFNKALKNLRNNLRADAATCHHKQHKTQISRKQATQISASILR